MENSQGEAAICNAFVQPDPIFVVIHFDRGIPVRPYVFVHMRCRHSTQQAARRQPVGTSLTAGLASPARCAVAAAANKQSTSGLAALSGHP